MNVFKRFNALINSLLVLLYSDLRRFGLATSIYFPVLRLSSVVKR